MFEATLTLDDITTCKQCNVGFVPLQTAIPKKFCSKKCRHLFNQLKHQAKTLQYKKQQKAALGFPPEWVAQTELFTDVWVFADLKPSKFATQEEKDNYINWALNKNIDVQQSYNGTYLFQKE